MSLVFAGCTAMVPKELTDARAVYARASFGPAAQAAPSELHKAKDSLDLAERAFLDAPDAQYTRDLAYVAERKAELAESVAVRELDKQNKAVSEHQYQTTQTQIQKDTKMELTLNRAQLAEAGRKNELRTVELDHERDVRVMAELLAADGEHMRAIQEQLTRLAAVKSEQRGLVITLSSDDLFPTDESTLLPEADTRLDHVADVLMATKERNLVVEGHTDAHGSVDHNLELAQRRAETVRTYLVSRGYQADRIQARGIGKARPISDNGSSEGRATNRRVEIVVEPKKTGG
jgi:outer membrane protein OmpA-like peptidoglycan-associated protein